MATQQKVDTSRWIVIYPAYIDSELTIAQGRKVSKEVSVKQPNVFDLKKACETLKVNFVLEKQRYSRQQWVMGRVRIQLKDENGVNITSFKNRITLIRAVAESVKNAREEAAKAQPAKKVGKK
ncbi:SRP19, putative [Entamoeba histolytica HM-1:IMSS-B]|uniref:Signal recognition particle 19 kDa protein, putative n=6 Tax=Entamoeba histolytica TaxID=5759 RepID=C4M2Q0_ENTH1|nr:Signal recognition particle 19 kDa protein, putative [Entamoeba histolytica HM-1:IMSS]EMD49106.1 signal recognition particle 19 kDa protein, putative [Entamoeba histolytica KU27]EMH77892.1 SRP19, putative [Entamoeba histolytica HM-1:IMSS-B]EMS14607.1 signal recognition particle 19 kda protein [Entamoeba histolytica HM-3:IMSS]ENY61376.1 signal recognition particle 19 kda protein, putative [Entamoeba histolytica HM-1:IMSS-A]GAT95559.1 signal recognition particle 19 kda protein putative [Entam|eukprot:XP_653439.1 Signal recognition particle 19 kDa protein, putative [Entamoeba histolytica HM-1:IMSS]